MEVRTSRMGESQRCLVISKPTTCLTGTPINRADRNTLWAFGADEDVQGYMSRYSFQDSIRDKATLLLHCKRHAGRPMILLDSYRR